MQITKRKNKVTERNRINKKLIALAVLFLCFFSGFSQTTQTNIFEDWSTSTGTQNMFQRSVVRTRTFSGTMYYYVAGATLNSSGNYDMLVSKLNSSGFLLWSQQYNGAGNGNDLATDLQVDAVGNVYVCGSYYKNSTDSNNAIVIKYNSSGTQKWAYTFNGAGSKNDGLTALSVNANTIFAVGVSWVNTTNKYDFLELRLDSSGSMVWQNTWNYATANLNEGATNLYSVGTALYVAGGVQSAFTTYKYGVVKFNPATGAVIGTPSVTGGTAFGIDKLTDIQQDASGNIYVTGGVMNMGTGYDYKTEKFDSTLTLLWSATYNGANSLDDVASGLYIDSLNNVIVTGSSKTTSNQNDYATVKYNSGGTQQWAATYNDTANGNDSATAIVAKGTNIYVTGKIYNGSSYDYYTVKYDGSGNQKWGISWNSTPNLNDVATAIALDTVGGVIVTGQTKTSSSFTYMTVRYSEKTVIVAPDTARLASNPLTFTANRGQLRDMSYHSELSVKYYCQSTTPQVYFQNKGIVSFQLAKIDKDSTTTDTIVRVDMTHASANNDVPARAFDLSNNYNTYYLSHIPDGAVQVKGFKQVVYSNLYSNIDLVFGSHSGGLKYSYIIKAGGNPLSIEEIFTGASSVAINGSGGIDVTTALGVITLPKATAFQIDGSGNFVSLGWQPSYSIVSGHVKFTGLGTYDVTKTLVLAIHMGTYEPPSIASIDNIVISTFAGGSLNDVFYDVTASVGGEMAVGSTNSTLFSGITGANSGNFIGTIDGILAWLPNGYDHVYAHCYIGGNGIDEFYAVTVNQNPPNANLKVYFSGYTTSSGMTTQSSGIGSFVQSSRLGNSDAFIGEMVMNFNTNIWRTYFGGSLNGLQGETINDLFWDNGYLYFTGRDTNNVSSSTESHAYNNSLGTTIIGKFNSHDSLIWCTKFGSGTGNSLSRRNNSMVVVGEMSATNLPIMTPSGAAYSKTSPNATDAFIARFNLSDTLTWSTYYGGTANDAAQGVVIDQNNDIYVTGKTYSSDFEHYYTGAAYFDTTLTGTYDAFMLKFNSGGVRLWSSYFGGSYYESGTSVVIDAYNDVYFLGYTTSNNMYIQNCNTLYNHSTIGGNPINSATWGDGYIFMLRPTLQPVWSTYYGGNLPDGINGAFSDANNYLHMVGFAGSSDGSTFPIVGSTAEYYNHGAGNDDAFYAKLLISNMMAVPVYENTSVGDFNLFPNPSNGQLTIDAGKNGQPQTLIITNTLGQIVYSKTRPEMDSNGVLLLDLSFLKQGIYFLNLQYGDISETKKFSIIK